MNFRVEADVFIVIVLVEDVADLIEEGMLLFRCKKQLWGKFARLDRGKYSYNSMRLHDSRI